MRNPGISIPIPIKDATHFGKRLFANDQRKSQYETNEFKPNLLSKEDDLNKINHMEQIPQTEKTL